VLDLTSYWAGPIVGRLMADLGADVIKVESVQRIDGWRGSFAPGAAERPYELSPAHNQINVNKRGITLNLRSAAGLTLCKQLAAVCDVVLENYSPRVMAQFGLDYPVLRELNPRLVMLSLSGFGASGPYRDYVSYALTVECMSGVPAATGYVDGPPMQQGASIGDPLGGLNGAVATLMALWRARRTGEGCWLDVSQIEGVTALLGDWLLEYTINGRLPARRGNMHPQYCPHGVYPCSGDRVEGIGFRGDEGDQIGFGGSESARRVAPDDEWIAIAVEDEEQWRALCGAIGRPELAEDPRFSGLSERRANAAALDAIIADWTRERDKYSAQAALLAAGVPAGALQTNIETLSDPQLLARGFWQELQREFVGRHPHGGSGVLVDGVAPPLIRPAPTLGQHTAEVLGELLGLSAAELAALEAQQVIGTQAL
jgi:crotonobetainyl-CoA:carnitine CoA-transferase CaiB-like acyl-CoA transferase